MKAQLFNKITKAAISELSEKIATPKGAASYSFVSGTGKKGNFEIYTFFDKAGKIMKRNSNYVNGNDTTKFITQYSDTATKSAKIVNGRAESVTKTNFRYGNKEKCLFTQATTSRGSAEDVQKITYLEKGKAPQSIEIKTSWDGNAPEINYTNTKPIFDSEDATEYLPGIIDNTSFRRFEHVYKYQIKEQDLEDVFDSFRIITRPDVKKLSKDLAELDEGVGVAGIFEETTGDVFYVLNKENLAFADEVETIAHEVQHAKDYSDIARLKDTMRYDCNKAFYDKSRAKGLIMKSKQKKDYKRLSKLRDSLTSDDVYKKECLNGKHDELPIEIPAIMKGYEESEICSAIWRKIMVHFGFWGA